ncbi:MAG: hypothetical protein WAK93_11380 [Solirubrobacteraceae bacterium]
MLERLVGRSVAVGLLAVACVLAGAAGAIASPTSRPVLKSPGNGKRVHAGHVKLKVFDPGVPKDVSPVYVTISNKRSLDRFGHLKVHSHCASKCDFVALRRGGGGTWTYKAPFNFPGYWAVTPGKYYWQASHTAPLCQAKGCEIVSKIHTFRVTG